MEVLMKKQSRESLLKKGVDNLRNLFNQGKKSRRPIKEQEVAQRGNVENLNKDETSSR
tara:strand:+ start:1049 stop:1222 length:174 start_codon:yes stop_codon:yes gene_type:complete